MPRLVLVDDDGRPLFACSVSRKNAAAVASFVRANRGAFEALAAMRRAFSSAFDGAHPAGRLVNNPPRPQPRPRRAVVTPTYTPPRRRRR